MIRFFSGIAKSWVGPLIMGVLLISFGVLGSSTGMRSVLGMRGANDIVDAGSHVVTENQFKRVVDQIEKRIEARTGQPYSVEEAVREGADKRAVQDLASEAAFAEMLKRSGIDPTDDVVARALRRQAESSPSLSGVFDPISGKFRPKELSFLLSQLGLTMDEFKSELADSLAENDVLSAVGGGFALPKIYGAAQAALALQQRDLTYFLIPPQDAPRPPPPTDAQLTAIIAQEHMMAPERRVLTVVRFSAKALAPTLQVSDADIAQQFAFEKSNLVKPELRSIVEIPLNDPRAAPRVEAALKGGEDPQAVAKSVGADAVNYADQPEGAIADRKAAQAAFKMQLGEVSGPVQGDFKTVILKVTKITPAQTPDLATAKPQIEAELRQKEAIEKVYDLSDKFQGLRQSGASIADAAAKVGTAAVTIGPVSANGQVEGSPTLSPLLSQKLLATAFQLPAGGDSELEQDADKGEYYAVHVDKVIAPAPRSLDEPGLRQQLTQYYFEKALLDGEQAIAAKAEAAIAKGQSLEAAAASVHGQIGRLPGVQEVAEQQYVRVLGSKFLLNIFEAKPGEVFSGVTARGVVVARLDAVRPADPGQVAALIASFRPQFTQAYLGEITDAMAKAAVDEVKPRTNLDLARQVMGVDAATLARATAKPANAAPRAAQ
jgi:peptidyl-prolyl cis-trans isomerase D